MRAVWLIVDDDGTVVVNRVFMTQEHAARCCLLGERPTRFIPSALTAEELETTRLALEALGGNR